MVLEQLNLHKRDKVSGVGILNILSITLLPLFHIPSITSILSPPFRTTGRNTWTKLFEYLGSPLDGVLGIMEIQCYTTCIYLAHEPTNSILHCLAMLLQVHGALQQASRCQADFDVSPLPLWPKARVIKTCMYNLSFRIIHQASRAG